MPVHRVVIEEDLYRRLEILARKHRRTVPATLALVVLAALDKALIGEQRSPESWGPVPKPGKP